MGQLASTMIGELDWADFETLVDLIFSRNGWRRGSVLGKAQADVDLLVDHPLTGEKDGFRSSRRRTRLSLMTIWADLHEMAVLSTFFYVAHTVEGSLTLPQPAGAHLHLWTGSDLAEIVVKVGLFDWVMQRTR